MAIDNLSSVTSKLADQMRRNAVTQINTQMQNLMTSGTVNLLQQSMQAMTVSKPSPGSVASILNVLA